MAGRFGRRAVRAERRRERVQHQDLGVRPDDQEQFQADLYRRARVGQLLCDEGPCAQGRHSAVVPGKREEQNIRNARRRVL